MLLRVACLAGLHRYSMPVYARQSRERLELLPLI